MKFMNENFMLGSETAIKLYHDYAAKMPIIDYHCHLIPAEISEDKKHENITQVWLYGDHYKWRAMRSNGVDEKYITGNSSDYEKYEKWTETMPSLVGNPLYTWTHLELKRFFGIDKPLCPDTAKEIWDITCEKLKNMSARQLILNSNVKVICTTDDPADDLKYHIAINADESFPCSVRPTYRPDKAIHIENEGFDKYLEGMGKVTCVDDVFAWLYDRADFFNAQGCVISDHAFEMLPFEGVDKEAADAVLKKYLAGGNVTQQDADVYATYIVYMLAKKYHELGWAMQLHVGAIRNVNTKMFKLLGPDTGFDAVGEASTAAKLAQLLDALDSEGKLPKTILYTLTPANYYKMTTIMGAFQGTEAKGKIQLGSGWWFLDHKEGMEEQLKILASTGLLGNFVGMLTDSRSFLSYPRHEYFRRILCNFIGDLIERGEFPEDMDMAGKIVENISYNNVKAYLGL